MISQKRLLNFKKDYLKKKKDDMVISFSRDIHVLTRKASKHSSLGRDRSLRPGGVAPKLALVPGLRNSRVISSVIFWHRPE